jgi:hypothetical protein
MLTINWILFLFYCILKSAFVDQYIEYKNLLYERHPLFYILKHDARYTTWYNNNNNNKIKVILRTNNKDIPTVKFLIEPSLKFQVFCKIETCWLENIYRRFEGYSLYRVKSPKSWMIIKREARTWSLATKTALYETRRKICCSK